jgi:cytosine/adenosine deaminase-related metal-dependent hydrolase
MMAESLESPSARIDDHAAGEWVSRRQFLQSTGAIALAAAVPSCGSPEQGARTKAARAKRGRGGSGTLLVKNCHTLVTMDERRREILRGGLFVRGNVIEQVGTATDLPTTADDVLDLQYRYIVMPGMINTHHHFHQVLTRVVKPDGTLFPWLKALYPIWANMRSEDIYLSAKLAAAELLLSGCTTSSDHLYILPNDCTIDDEIRALAEIGMRFTVVRGSMSIGESKGGLPPDSVVEDEADILKDSQRLIERYHDMSRHSMIRVALGPCSPFTISTDLMKESAVLARQYDGVRLHTHLAENQDDIAYTLENYGARPGPWTESLGWLADDVWHAHVVWLDDTEIGMFAEAGVGGAHCPCSNMRLGSGAAPVRAMLDAGMPLGLGVDGSASNDTSNLIHEARQALLLARVRETDVTGMSAREALEIATVGGAKVLGRDDIGHLAPGMSADFVAFDALSNAHVGDHADPVAALVLCQTDRVAYSFVNGRRVVDQGVLTTVDHDLLAEKTRKAAERLSS